MKRDKRSKFVELAEKRVNRAIHDLRLIGNLANKSNYDYSASDMEKILTALEGETRKLRGRLLSDGAREPWTFKL